MATVLVIEDGPKARQLFRAQLETLGHDVWEAANGKDGIALCRLLLPDLVVTDIMMPVQDGIETMVELKAIFTGAKFIAMSAHPDKLELALRLGAKDVLQKPFSPQELGEAVQEAVEALNAQSKSHSIRPVYVRVELNGEDNTSERTYTLSPVPFWEGFDGDIRPTKEEKTIVATYAGLRKTLLTKFNIPRDLIPFREFFDPTPEDRDETRWYRTLPEGLGEPEWRVQAEQAIRDALDEASFSGEYGAIELNRTRCFSMDQVRHELEQIAESAGGKETPGEPYGAKYEELIDSILRDYPWLGVQGKRHRR